MELTPVARVDDIITIEGYGDRLFRVTGYTHEFTYNKHESYEEIWYDCYCVITAEFMMAEQDDVMSVVLAHESKAIIDDYLERQADLILSNVFTDYGDWKDAEITKEAYEPMTKKPKEKTRNQRIDELLDEMNNVRETRVILGEDHYAERMDEINVQLAELNEGR